MVGLVGRYVYSSLSIGCIFYSNSYAILHTYYILIYILFSTFILITYFYFILLLFYTSAKQKSFPFASGVPVN